MSQQNGEREVIGPDLVGVSLGSWAYKGEIRYFDTEAGELDTVTPENGAIYTVMIVAQNLGGSPTELPPGDEFVLIANGEQYEPTSELPGGVSWDDIRQRPGTTRLRSPRNYIGTYQGDVEGGTTGQLVLPFDAPVDEQFSIGWVFEEDGEKVVHEIAPPE